MSAHTPGPWSVGAQNDMLFIIDRAPAANNDYPDHNADRAVIAHVYDEARGHDGIANASLIAAAPELYAALVAVLAWAAPIAGDNQNDVAAQKEISAIDLANAALAKARGEA